MRLHHQLIYCEPSCSHSIARLAGFMEKPWILVETLSILCTCSMHTPLGTHQKENTFCWVVRMGADVLTDIDSIENYDIIRVALISSTIPRRTLTSNPINFESLGIT